MKTQLNNTIHYRPKTWRERKRELDRKIQWQRFLDKYHEERISSLFGPHEHREKATWGRLLDVVNGRGFQGHRYI